MSDPLMYRAVLAINLGDQVISSEVQLVCNTGEAWAALGSAIHDSVPLEINANGIRFYDKAFKFADREAPQYRPIRTYRRSDKP